MRVSFAFGKDGLNLELPDDRRFEILESRSPAPLADVPSALARALDHPIESPPLVELARGRRSAAIAVCDITRPAPNSVTLPPLLERLHAAGIERGKVTIYIATGLHRPATAEEIAAIVGPDIAARYRVENHHARDPESHLSLGTTRRGTPVHLQRGFVEADLHITLGLIEQHLMAGFSGGRKLIAPGCAAQETIKALHSPAFIREPGATEGSISGNPLHAELLEIAAMAGHHFMLDVTLTRTRAISGVFAGDGARAHLAGVEFVRSHLLETLREPADAVITSAAGYPLDLTFYQTIKGVTAAEHVVKPGGRILVVGECAEGLGGAEFREKLGEFRGWQEYLDAIVATPVIPDQWQLEKLALTGLRNELFFYTPGASPSAAGLLAERMHRRPEDAVSALLAGLPGDALVALIPEGPYVFAQARGPIGD